MHAGTPSQLELNLARAAESKDISLSTTTPISGIFSAGITFDQSARDSHTWRRARNGIQSTAVDGGHSPPPNKTQYQQLYRHKERDAHIERAVHTHLFQRVEQPTEVLAPQSRTRVNHLEQQALHAAGKDNLRRLFRQWAHARVKHFPGAVVSKHNLARTRTVERQSGV